VFQLGIHYLLGQQRTDGRFGYMGVEAAPLEKSPGSNTTYRIYLPVTVSCMWALAEALTPRFRRFALTSNRTLK
jgi:hypothetical protein